MEVLSRLMLQDNQSRLFLLMNNEDIDVIDGISKFMKSNLAKDIDKEFSSIQLSSSNIWLDELHNEVNINKGIKDEYNIEAIMWLGYFYRKWHYITGEPSFKIVRYLSPKEGLKGYMLYHQIEEKDAINIIKSRHNQKRNIHRKYDYKDVNDVLDNNDLKNTSLLSYLSKRMLYKLSNDERINELIYINKENMFISKERNESLSTLVYKNNDLCKLIKDYKVPSYENNTLFIYISNGKYNKDTLKKEIIKIREDNLDSKYISIYFYISGLLYEINNSREIHYYHMKFTNRDKTIAMKELELDKTYDEIETKLNQ